MRGFQTTIQELVANGKTEEAIQYLLKYSGREEDVSLYQEALMLSAQYKRYSKECRLGTGRTEDQKVTVMRINAALLQLTNVSVLESDATILPRRKRLFLSIICLVISLGILGLIHLMKADNLFQEKTKLDNNIIKTETNKEGIDTSSSFYKKMKKSVTTINTKEDNNINSPKTKKATEELQKQKKTLSTTNTIIKSDGAKIINNVQANGDVNIN